MAIFFIAIFVLVWFAIVAGTAFTMPVMTNFFPGQEGMTMVGIISLLFTVGIPLLGVVLLIVRIAFRRKIQTGWLVGLGAFWLLNAITLAGIGGTLAQEFVAEDSITENIDITTSTAGTDTLKLTYYQMESSPEKQFRFGGDAIELPDACVDFIVQKSTDGQWSLEKSISARGRTEHAARTLASSLSVPLQQAKGTLAAPQGIPFDEIPKWRGQEVKLSVHAPVGAYLRFNRHHVRANYTGSVAYDKLRDTELYQMQKNGQLKCLSCAAPELETEATQDEILGLLQESDYQRIRINGPLKVTIEQGEEYDLSINGSEQYLQRLEQEVNDGVLYLTLDAESTDSPVQLFLTMPTLESLELDNTDDVRVKDFEGTLSINAYSRADIKVDGRYELFTVDLADVAALEFTGEADQLHATLSNVSRLDTDRGTVDQATLVLRDQSRAKLSKATQINSQELSEGSTLRTVD